MNHQVECSTPLVPLILELIPWFWYLLHCNTELVAFSGRIAVYLLHSMQQQDSKYPYSGRYLFLLSIRDSCLSIFLTQIILLLNSINSLVKCKASKNWLKTQNCSSPRKSLVKTKDLCDLKRNQSMSLQFLYQSGVFSKFCWNVVIKHIL